METAIFGVRFCAYLWNWDSRAYWRNVYFMAYQNNFDLVKVHEVIKYGS